MREEVVINSQIPDESRWYAVHTRPNEESRAESNLMAWRVETFNPKIKEVRYNQFNNRPISLIKPLFCRYIFARFDANKLLHKVYYTRGVHSVVSFGNNPIPVDDEAIQMIKERIEEDGFVRLDEDLVKGDEVTITEGSFKNFTGIFDRSIKASDRVMILLTTVSFQANVMLARNQVRKIKHTA